MITWTHNAIKNNAKINCMSNKHDALKKLKLKAIESNKHKNGYQKKKKKPRYTNNTKENTKT